MSIIASPITAISPMMLWFRIACHSHRATVVVLDAYFWAHSRFGRFMPRETILTLVIACHAHRSFAYESREIPSKAEMLSRLRVTLPIPPHCTITAHHDATIEYCTGRSCTRL